MAKQVYIAPTYAKDTSNTERQIFDRDAYLYQLGTKITSTAAELNILDGVTATATELNALDVSANGAGTKYATCSLPIVAATTETDSTIALTGTFAIKNAWVKVATEEATGATKTIDIGIKTVDADGVLNGVSVAATGVIGGTLLNTGQTLGALMSVDEDGSGTLVREPYIVTDPTFTYSLGSNDFAEMVATLIVEYVEFA